MATHLVRQFLQTAGAQVPAAASDADLTLTGSSQSRLEETIPAASTNLQLFIAIDVSALKSLFIYCERALTIKTNDSGAPDSTISLLAGQALHWHTLAYFANPLVAADVTDIYVTLAAGEDADLFIDILQDATP